MEYPWNIVAYVLMGLLLLSGLKDIFKARAKSKEKEKRLLAEYNQMTKESKEYLTRVFSAEFNSESELNKDIPRSLLHKNVITFRPQMASGAIVSAFNAYISTLILREKSEASAPAKDLYEDGLNDEERLAATLIICAYACAGEALGRNREDKPMALAGLLAICFMTFETSIRPLNYSMIDSNKLQKVMQDAFTLFMAMIVEKPIKEALKDDYKNLRALLEECQYRYKNERT